MNGPNEVRRGSATLSAGVAARWAAIFACILLPWINPFAAGPSSSVDPWLLSAVCVAIAFAIVPPGRLAPGLVLGLAAFAAWTLARTGMSPESLALAAACLLVLMAAATAAGGMRDAAFLDAVALAWLVAAMVSTGIGLVQYFGASEALAPWVTASATGEAFANLRQRNQFATLTTIGMASLFWLFPRRLGWGMALPAMAWLAVGNAATTSRTGLLEIIVLGAFAVASPGQRRARGWLWLTGIAAYAAAALALPWVLEAATGVVGNRLWDRVAAVDTCSSRAVLWSNVMHLIAQQPWLGWGWGELDYAHFATLYEGARFCDILDNAHNLPLHLAVELGIPAALAVCGLLLVAVLRARPWAEHDPARQMAWAVLAVLGIHSLLEYPLWYGPFQVAFGLALGLLWARAGEAARNDGVALRGRTAALLLAAGVAGACGYAEWDYRRVSQIYLPPQARTPAMREDPLPFIRRSWLFRNQALFAELTITPLTRANAGWVHDSAQALLHYSPEPRVIEKVIESATMLGRDQEAVMELARFRAAFPEAYRKWSGKGRAGESATAQVQPAT